MTNAVVAPLDESQIAEAGRVLAIALGDDPLQNHVFPNPEERVKLAPLQFSTLVRQAHLFGRVLATEGLTGVSAWTPPGEATTYEQAQQSGYSELPFLLGKENFERLGRVFDYLSSTHGTTVPAEHWYLMIVGVLPQHQGRGIGEALLRPIVAQADAGRVPICLDTAQPLVKPFYERLGFRMVIESVDPNSGLRFWTYQRDPS
jgi:GNAT superfamily N-acetyltransferase